MEREEYIELIHLIKKLLKEVSTLTGTTEIILNATITYAENKIKQLEGTE